MAAPIAHPIKRECSMHDFARNHRRPQVERWLAEGPF
jgi:hypothetical protein